MAGIELPAFQQQWRSMEPSRRSGSSRGRSGGKSQGPAKRCVQPNADKTPCGRTTTNTSGDCGQHGSAGSAPTVPAAAAAGAKLQHQNGAGAGPLNFKEVAAGTGLRNPSQKLLAMARDETLRSVEHVKHHPYAAMPAMSHEYTYIPQLNDERWAIPNDPDVTPATLAVLARSEHLDVVQAVGRGRHSDAGTLARLAGHESAEVRRAVAENGNTGSDTLAGLASDGELSVRAAVAVNTSSSALALEQLASDSHAHIRERIAARSDVGPALLNRLTDDRKRAVRRQAKRSLRRSS